jgi:hypothetical protein
VSDDNGSDLRHNPIVVVWPSLKAAVPLFSSLLIFRASISHTHILSVSAAHCRPFVSDWCVWWLPSCLGCWRLSWNQSNSPGVTCWHGCRVWSLVNCLPFVPCRVCVYVLAWLVSRVIANLFCCPTSRSRSFTCARAARAHTLAGAAVFSPESSLVRSPRAHSQYINFCTSLNRARSEEGWMCRYTFLLLALWCDKERF